MSPSTPAAQLGDVAYLAIWRRDASEPRVEVPWPESVHVDPLFPAEAQARWAAGAVHATSAAPHTACLLRLTPSRARNGGRPAR